jgi:outer membrane receptor protein involved in Fe transport
MTGKSIMNVQVYMVLILVVIFCGVAFSADLPQDAEVHELPEVTVTAPHEQDYTTLPERNLIERPITESPGLDIAISVVGRKEIEEQNPYSIVDAMNYVSGAWTETRGRKVKKFFSVRGQRYPYPGYLVDGAWFREFHEINYYLSAANFDRIEILRSSSALLLGPGGLTGMVNLIPRTYDRRETHIEGIYGTHNSFRGNVSHGGQGKNYNYGVGVGYFHTEGASGMNAMENMINLYGRIKYRLNNKLDLSWSNYLLLGDRELRLALPPASNTMQTRRDSFDPMQTYVTVARLRYEPDKSQATEFIANYGSRRFDGHRVGNPEWLEEDYEYGATIIHSRELNSDNILRITGLFHRWVTPTGKRFYVGNPGDIRTYSAAIADEHDFGKLLASIGYRYSREHIKEFGGFNVEGTPGPLRSVKVNDEWSDPLHAVNLGASFEVTGSMSFLGNISWGQLAAQPGMLDLNLNQPGAEDRYKFDLGVRWRKESFGELGLTGFYTRRKDAALASGTTVLVSGEPYVLFTTDDQENYGFEMDLRTCRFSSGVQFFINATAMQTRRTMNGIWVDDREVPEIILGGGLLYGRNGFSLSLYAKHLSEYENERFLPAGSPPAPLGAFTDLTGQVAYRYKTGMEIFARVENIMNDEYSTVAGYPHEGALFYIGIKRLFIDR